MARYAGELLASEGPYSLSEAEESLFVHFLIFGDK